MVFFKVLKLDNLKNVLDETILSHSQAKYKGEALIESLFAYETLSLLYEEKTGKKLKGVYFDSDGKPKSKEVAITITHSHGVVGVGLSLNPNDTIAIDVEKVKDIKKPLIKLLNLNKDCTKEEFYLKWTKKECYKKAFNLSLLNSEEREFIGESKIIKIDGEVYALSVYCEGDYEINI